MNRRAALVFALAALALLFASLAAAHRLGRESVLAAFTTDLSARSGAQRKNIELAVARLDGRVIGPGKSLSFNDTVGRRALELGYERAPAMTVAGVEDEPGGGICQLSSTVYNAGLLAGMTVSERWPHAHRVQSVGPGRDATVLYGRWDLRLGNPYAFTVRLRTRIIGHRLVAEVLGSAPLPVPVEVRVERAPSGGGFLRVETWRRIGRRDERISQDAYPIPPHAIR